MATQAAKDSSALNRATYESARIVGQYARFEDLYPAESLILDRFSAQFHHSILDIGIGAGRTTRVLLPQCEHYVGIDYSAPMIDRARSQFPAADLRVLDMRDVVHVFAEQRFDAILISFNAIDCISWDDRCALLAALPRLLTADGVLVFSTHDLADADRQSRFHLRDDLQRTLRSAYRPRSLAKLIRRTPAWLLKALRNRHRNRRLQRYFDGYAYINDAAEDYGLLLTYVGMTKQTELLKSWGFSRLEILQPWLRDEQTSFSYLTCQR